MQLMLWVLNVTPGPGGQGTRNETLLLSRWTIGIERIFALFVSNVVQ